MRKVKIGILVILLLTVFSISVQGQEQGEVQSAYVLVADLNTSQVLYAKQADEKLYPASMTKVLTVLTAMDKIDNLNEKVTITEDMLVGLEDGTYSLTGFINGEVVTMRDLLYGAMLPSGADACQALGVLIYGSEENMVEAMNAKAQSLGMTHSHFTNTVGMHDEDHYTSASDLELLMRAAWANTDIKAAMSTKQYTTSSSYYHGDGLLLQNSWANQVAYAGIEDTHIIGGKTGYTPEAGYCFFGVCEIKEKPVIVVFAKAKEDGSSLNVNSVKDVETVCTYLEEQKKPITLAQQGEEVVSLDLHYTFHDPLSLTAPYDIVAWLDSNEKATASMQVTIEKQQAPVEKGEILAEIQVLSEEKTLFTIPVYAQEAVDSDIGAIIIDTLTFLIWPYGLMIMLVAAALSWLLWIKKEKA